MIADQRLDEADAPLQVITPLRRAWLVLAVVFMADITNLIAPHHPSTRKERA